LLPIRLDNRGIAVPSRRSAACAPGWSTNTYRDAAQSPRADVRPSSTCAAVDSCAVWREVSDLMLS
jgi:hypothetical protein